MKKKVVRWCSEYGAVVVDRDISGRVYPVYYKGLRYSNITKKHGLE